MIMLLMGVSGCGKTTVGQQLAERLGWSYQEGDTLPTASKTITPRASLRHSDRSPTAISQ